MIQLPVLTRQWLSCQLLQGSLQPTINLELPLIPETMPLFKMIGLLCNKFKGGKDKVMMVLAIRVMLLVLWETIHEGRQGLLNAIIVKVNDTWLGNALSLRGQGMLHGSRIRKCSQAAQTTIPNNAAFQTEDLDAYDFECDDVSNAKSVSMASLSNYCSNVISNVPHSESYHNDMGNQNLLDEITEVQTVFNQMEVAVQQCSVDKQYVLLTVMNSIIVYGDSMNLEMQRSQSYDKCLDLDAELLKKQNAYNELLKSYSQLKKHCISLELTTQLNQEIFQKDKSCDSQNALEIPEYFENNNLKVQLQAKDTTIRKLKEHIKSMRENDKEDKVKQYMNEIETIKIELEHSVAKLLSENELLHKEIKHLKNIYKDQFDSIKKICALSKEHCKYVLDNATTITNATTIASRMFKLDLEPLSTKLLNNREAHIHYLKKTKEHVDILRGIVEQAKAKQPLDSALDFACKHVTRIQELLVYVRDTCLAVNKSSEKLVAVTPMNKVKKVRFSEPVTSSSNIHKQIESSKTPDSNTHVLPST
ncbi:hypothetical protein Tco_0005043 [Tanacetum coccineum]